MVFDAWGFWDYNIVKCSVFALNCGKSDKDGAILFFKDFYAFEGQCVIQGDFGVSL